MWDKIIKYEKKQKYFQQIILFLKKESQKGKKIFPDKKNIFEAFKLTPWDAVKVVLLGQDPYPGFNQAHGLAFSTLDLKTPASLKNIFQELKYDLDLEINYNNNLTSWALQGVLLLNVILTVEKGKPLSHQGIGWEQFIQNILIYLKQKSKIVYLLWGKLSQSYKKYIDLKNNYILESTHPSPLSAHRGFFGSKPFSKTNSFLEQNQISSINWNLQKSTVQ